MEISLRERTAEHVRIYFEKSSDPEILKMMPRKAQTLEEALEDYGKTLLPGSSSYGNTIYADDIYVGDVWCYGIDLQEEPNCMLSCCVFEKAYWSKGIATRAVALFLEKLRLQYGIQTVGAFAYAQNIASVTMLKKNGFTVVEEIEEDGISSVYLQKRME